MRFRRAANIVALTLSWACTECRSSASSPSSGDRGLAGNGGGSASESRVGSPGSSSGGATSSQSTPTENDAFVVDVASGNTPISPAIYGVAFADQKTLQVATVHRFGGDCATTYNWKVDAFNCGSDNRFHNAALKGFGYPPYNDPNIPSSLTAIDYMVQQTRKAHADVLMTVPMIGWVASDSTSVADSSGSDPAKASVPTSGQFMQDWVTHLVSTFGGANSGGVKYYELDNEPDDWAGIHKNIHKLNPTSGELWADIQTYASAIKAADPAALVLAYSPALLSSLVTSPADHFGKGGDEPGGPPWDSHGAIVRPFAGWLLDQAANYQKTHGVRIVDCLDFHYPTAGSHPIEDTRSLWDPTYDEQSWESRGAFKGPIYILPRLQQWIGAHYPGTGICISEYNYYNGRDGGGNMAAKADVHSAVVEADALGIFGKYGVTLATYWTNLVDDSGTPVPTYSAFAMYTNYDGQGARFGNNSVGATTTVPDVTVYAATDSPAAPKMLWVMIINKTDTDLGGFGLRIKNFTPGATAKLYRYTSVAGSGPNLSLPVLVGSLPVTNRSVTVSAPRLSIDLLVIPAG